MPDLLKELPHIYSLNHFVLTLIILITMVLVSRTVVAGTKYSSILIIVVFGLLMGYVMVESDIAKPGFSGFPVIVLASKTTIIALIASFFVGGQELKKILFKQSFDTEQIMVPSSDEVVLGTTRTQLCFLLRAFFILIGIASVKTIITGIKDGDVLGSSYLLFGYLSLVLAVICICTKAKIVSKQQYIRKGVLEIIVILAILLGSLYIANFFKSSGWITLPQIFFAMLISASLGMIFSNWRLGPTINALLFAGIPIVLAGNFLVGGSRIAEAFGKEGVTDVMIYGFTGQIFWMFAGIALLIFVGKANNVRNLAPGMAGSLSHSGLTGACTGGDLGEKAASRAPIMINIPFFGHIFVFSILAASAEKGELLYAWIAPIILIGLGLTAYSLRTLRKANGDDAAEVKGLMQYSFGWQITAVFSSFFLLSWVGMPLDHVSIAVSSALSHFGLFAAVQGGMFDKTAVNGVPSELIAFIFAMPFLVHPLVFGMFGKAAENEGKMSKKIVLLLATIGTVGVIFCLCTI